MPELDVLPEAHAARLRWFAERSGQIVGWPGKDSAGRHLVTRAKGIFKPEDLEYALSVRIMLESPYPDGDVSRSTDGTWSVAYHQERLDPDERDADYTNAALVRNMDDGTPVAVMREVPPPEKPRRYEVLGLAKVRGWEDGYFLLAGGPNAEGVDWTALTLQLAEEEAAGDEAEPEADGGPPTDDYDARRRVMRTVVARRGQPGFRSLLLEEYGRRCAVSGCAVEEVLEAAHLRPYRGPESNTAPNGLLLRSDLHTLLDLGLMRIRPEDRTVWFAPSPRHKPPYESLHERPLRNPTTPSARPSHDVLVRLWSEPE